MPIKRETLEKKWYYRAARVALIAFPFVLIILWLLSLLRGNAVTCAIAPKYDPAEIQRMVVYFIVGLIAYFLLLVIITRAFFYVAFGGVEEEKRKGWGGQAATEKPKNTKISEIIPLIILLIIFVIFVLSEMGKIRLPKINVNGSVSTSGTAGRVCHRTSAEWGLACGSVRDGVGVSGLPIPAPCGCPVDTEYSGTTDVVTPGGPYKICVCK